MRLLVTGSIATDYLMEFPGSFADQILPDKLDSISLSFLVDELAIRRGGAAANIAFNLGWLGLRPVLIGAVGEDFREYGQWLAEHGVDIDSVHASTRRHTARFLCTTDAHNNQVASFYAGAMAEARDIELAPILARVGEAAFVLISPNDPDAMLRHTEECRQVGVPFGADPSQQLARMDGSQIAALVDGADYLFTNEYERGLLEHKTGWTADEVQRRVGVWITTLGPRGASVRRRGQPELLVGPAPELDRRDPTGVGDAFRSGFLAGVQWGLDDAGCAQLGCTLATIVLEVLGTQEHSVDTDHLLRRLGQAYGEGIAAQVSSHLPQPSLR